MPADFTDDVDPLARSTNEPLVIELDFATVKRLIEKYLGGPCFRMWINDPVFLAARSDYGLHKPRGGSGRWAVWRTEQQYQAASRDIRAWIDANRIDEKELGNG